MRRARQRREHLVALGQPGARDTSRPVGSRISVVGVRSTRSARTTSRWCSASTSTWVTPGTSSATSPSTRGWPGTAHRRPRRTAAASPAPPGVRRRPRAASSVGAGLGRHARTRARRRATAAGAAEAAVGRDAVHAEADDEQHATRAAPTARSSCQAQPRRRSVHSARGSAQPPAKGGRNSTVSPGATWTVAGSCEPTGRSPTSTEQTPSTASRLVPGCRATARSRSVGQRQRPVHRHGVLGDAGRGPGGRPVPQRDDAHRCLNIVAGGHALLHAGYPSPSAKDVRASLTQPGLAHAEEC